MERRTAGGSRSERGPAGGRLTSLITTAVAVVAIGLGVWEGMENRRHNRLSVIPQVAAHVRLDPRGGSLTFSSDGLGPAAIRAFRIYFDSKLIHDSDAGLAAYWAPVLSALQGGGYAIRTETLGRDMLLRTGEDYPVFELAVHDSTAPAAVAEVLARIAVQVCYCSVYGEPCRSAVAATVLPALQPCPSAPQ